MSHYRIPYISRSGAASKDRQVSRNVTTGMMSHTSGAMFRGAARRTAQAHLLVEKNHCEAWHLPHQSEVECRTEPDRAGGPTRLAGAADSARGDEITRAKLVPAA